jgi:magnesium transporter
MLFQDRITGMLEAHLSNVSNRLNEVMKVLTIVSTLLMPPTLLTSLYGMNVPLPHLPGGEGMQFWWVIGITLSVSGVMLTLFRRRRWI